MSDSNPVSLDLRNRAREIIDDFNSLRWRITGLVILMIVGLGVYGLTRVGQTGESSKYPHSSSSSYSSYSTTTASVTSTTTNSQLVVYAVGGIKNPGLYTVSASARVSDVVNAAGGLSDDADTGRINLAAKVTDGQRVYIVRKGESAPADDSSGSNSGASSSGPIDINDASEQELENLPGVGPSTAAAIVQYRTQHGSFASVDALSNVKGIGPAKLAQIKPDATV